MDPLSPGSVSSIDSDLLLAPLPEAIYPADSMISIVESIRKVVDSPVEKRKAPTVRGGEGSLDLRVRLKGKDRKVLVLELDSIGSLIKVCRSR